MTLRARIPGHQVLRHAVFAVALMTAVAAAAAAQPANQQAPGPFQGMQVSRDKPIQINATTLEVRDKEKRATFIGKVVVVQGDTTLKCNKLDVFYEQNAAAPDPSKPPPAPGPGGGQQQIKRLEAKGNVVVIQKEQTATGDAALYDLKSNSVTLTGNVTVTQGQNVIKGDRIVVDLTTGVTRVESGGSGDVSGLFLPNAPKKNDGKTDPKADTKTDAKVAPKAPTKQGQSQPLKLN